MSLRDLIILSRKWKSKYESEKKHGEKTRNEDSKRVIKEILKLRDKGITLPKKVRKALPYRFSTIYDQPKLTRFEYAKQKSEDFMADKEMWDNKIEAARAVERRKNFKNVEMAKKPPKEEEIEHLRKTLPKRPKKADTNLRILYKLFHNASYKGNKTYAEEYYDKIMKRLNRKVIRPNKEPQEAINLDHAFNKSPVDMTVAELVNKFPTLPEPPKETPKMKEITVRGVKLNITKEQFKKLKSAKDQKEMKSLLISWGYNLPQKEKPKKEQTTNADTVINQYINSIPSSPPENNKTLINYYRRLNEAKGRKDVEDVKTWFIAIQTYRKHMLNKHIFSKEAPKEVPKEAPKEAPKETPKEAPTQERELTLRERVRMIANRIPNHKQITKEQINEYAKAKGEPKFKRWEKSHNITETINPRNAKIKPNMNGQCKIVQRDTTLQKTQDTNATQMANHVSKSTNEKTPAPAPKQETRYEAPPPKEKAPAPKENKKVIHKVATGQLTPEQAAEVIAKENKSSETRYDKPSERTIESSRLATEAVVHNKTIGQLKDAIMEREKNPTPENREKERQLRNAYLRLINGGRNVRISARGGFKGKWKKTWKKTQDITMQDLANEINTQTKKLDKRRNRKGDPKVVKITGSVRQKVEDKVKDEKKEEKKEEKKTVEAKIEKAEQTPIAPTQVIVKTENGAAQDIPVAPAQQARQVIVQSEGGGGTVVAETQTPKVRGRKSLALASQEEDGRNIYRPSSEYDRYGNYRGLPDNNDVKGWHERYSQIRAIGNRAAQQPMNPLEAAAATTNLGAEMALQKGHPKAAGAGTAIGTAIQIAASAAKWAWKYSEKKRKKMAKRMKAGEKDYEDYKNDKVKKRKNKQLAMYYDMMKAKRQKNRDILKRLHEIKPEIKLDTARYFERQNNMTQLENFQHFQKKVLKRLKEQKEYFQEQGTTRTNLPLALQGAKAVHKQKDEGTIPKTPEQKAEEKLRKSSYEALARSFNQNRAEENSIYVKNHGEVKLDNIIPQGDDLAKRINIQHFIETHSDDFAVEKVLTESEFGGTDTKKLKALKGMTPERAREILTIRDPKVKEAMEGRTGFTIVDNPDYFQQQAQDWEYNKTVSNTRWNTFLDSAHLAIDAFIAFQPQINALAKGVKTFVGNALAYAGELKKSGFVKEAAQVEQKAKAQATKLVKQGNKQAAKLKTWLFGNPNTDVVDPGGPVYNSALLHDPNAEIPTEILEAYRGRLNTEVADPENPYDPPVDIRTKKDLVKKLNPWYKPEFTKEIRALNRKKKEAEKQAEKEAKAKGEQFKKESQIYKEEVDKILNKDPEVKKMEEHIATLNPEQKAFYESLAQQDDRIQELRKLSKSAENFATYFAKHGRIELNTKDITERWELEKEWHANKDKYKKEMEEKYPNRFTWSDSTKNGSYANMLLYENHVRGKAVGPFKASTLTKEQAENMGSYMNAFGHKLTTLKPDPMKSHTLEIPFIGAMFLGNENDKGYFKTGIADIDNDEAKRETYISDRAEVLMEAMAHGKINKEEFMEKWSQIMKDETYYKSVLEQNERERKKLAFEFTGKFHDAINTIRDTNDKILTMKTNKGKALIGPALRNQADDIHSGINRLMIDLAKIPRDKSERIDIEKYFTSEGTITDLQSNEIAQTFAAKIHDIGVIAPEDFKLYLDYTKEIHNNGKFFSRLKAKNYEKGERQQDWMTLASLVDNYERFINTFQVPIVGKSYGIHENTGGNRNLEFIRQEEAAKMSYDYVKKKLNEINFESPIYMLDNVVNYDKDLEHKHRIAPRIIAMMATSRNAVYADALSQIEDEQLRDFNVNVAFWLAEQTVGKTSKEAKEIGRHANDVLKQFGAHARHKRQMDIREEEWNMQDVGKKIKLGRQVRGRDTNWLSFEELNSIQYFKDVKSKLGSLKGSQNKIYAEDVNNMPHYSVTNEQAVVPRYQTDMSDPAGTRGTIVHADSSRTDASLAAARANNEANIMRNVSAEIPLGEED